MQARASVGEHLPLDLCRRTAWRYQLPSFAPRPPMPQAAKQKQLLAGGIMLFIRTSPFATGQFSFPQATSDSFTMNKAALKVLEGIYRESPAYAKAGVMLFDLTSRHSRNQYSLFPVVTPKEQERRDTLMAALDAVNRKMGGNTVQLASMGIGDAPWKMRQERTSPRATTEWGELAKARCD